MEYNKKRFYKFTDKRVLHKVKKQWIVVSLALLATLGGKAVASHLSAHASVNNRAAVNTDHENINAKRESTLHIKNNPQPAVANRQSVTRLSSVSQAANRLHQSILQNSIRSKDRSQNYAQRNDNLQAGTFGQPSKVAKVSPDNSRKSNYKLNDDNQTGIFVIHYLIYNPKYNHHSGHVDQAILKEDKGSHSVQYQNYINQPFNLSQYLSGLKSGYSLKDVIYNNEVTSKGSNVPKIYVPGTHNIYFEEYPSGQKSGEYDFRYLDADDDYFEDTHTSDYGMSGTPVQNVNSYLNSVPERNGNGIQINPNGTGETVVSAKYMGKTYSANQFPALEQKLKVFPEGDQVVEVNFRKNPNGLPGPINVTYRDPDSDNNDIVGKPNQSIRGHFYQIFSDITKEVSVPAGYELDPVSKQPASDFTTNSQDPYYHEISNQTQKITLDVHKKNGSDTADVPMYIQYVEYDKVNNRYRPVSGKYQFSSGFPNNPLNSSDLNPYLDPDYVHFPHGYTNPELVPNDPNTYNSKNNLVLVSVQPDQPREITRNYTVEVIKRDKNGHQVGLPSDKPESIKTQIGDSDSTVVDPNNFIPSGYYPDSNDHPQTITVDRNGNLNSNKVTFYYDQNTKPNGPSDQKRIKGSYTVKLILKDTDGMTHEQDYDESINDVQGQSKNVNVNPADYNKLIPSGYTPDKNNRMTSVTMNGQGNVNPKVVMFYYDQNTKPNGPSDQKRIKGSYTVKLILKNSDGTTHEHDYKEYISDVQGQSKNVNVNPADYNKLIPKGYISEVGNQTTPVTINGQGNVTPNVVTFYYDQTNSSDMAGQYTVNLYEKQNGQYKLVKTVPKELTGKKGYTNWLTPDEFRGLIPNAADYQDANPNQESSVHLDNSGRVIPGTVSFYYDPVNQTDHMTVEYLYNGQQIGNSIPVSGRNGSSFDITPYLSGKDVPAGYQSAIPQAGDPDKFVQNGQVLIDLHKAPASSDTMTVIYKYNGNPVGPSIQVSGKDGTPFNVQPYLALIPSGYISPSVQAGDPTYYVPNGQVIINLQKPSDGGNGNGGYTPTPMPSPTPSPVPNPTPNPTPNNNGGNNTPINNGNNTPTPSPTPNPKPAPNNNGGNNTPVNNGNNTPTPSPTPNPKPTPNNHGGNNTPNNNKNGGHTPIATPASNPVRNNKGHRNPSTSGSINSQPNNGINGDSVNQSKQKLPQTGEKQNDADIGNILMMMGATVALLGRALDRRRYNE